MPMRRIEFCGGIAAGKSTCAALLAERWAVPLISEEFERNSYWRNNIQNSASQALEKDLSFLLAHANDIQATTTPAAVCDFAMFQTIAYSSLAGDDADTNAVRLVHDRLLDRIGYPSLIIRVRCPNELQLQRIRERARVPEAKMTLDYLERLDSAIDRQLAELPAGCGLIEVDTSRSEAEFLDMSDLRVAMAELAR
jgi:deoxyadenosine/deoxycytidine kinase